MQGWMGKTEMISEKLLNSLHRQLQDEDHLIPLNNQKQTPVPLLREMIKWHMSKIRVTKSNDLDIAKG